MDGKRKYSNFHITVSPNVANIDLRAFRDAIDSMCEPPKNVWMWLRHYEDGEQKLFRGGNKRLVEAVRVRAAFEEKGQQNRTVHAHILVEVTHETRVQISKDGVQTLFALFLPHRPMVHVRFLKGNSEDKDFILHYITKEVPTGPVQDVGNRRLRAAFRDGEETDTHEARF